MNDSWQWMGQYGWNSRFLDALEVQTAEAAALRQTVSKHVEGIQKELKTVQGSVDGRLNELTEAFLNYAKMDGFEKELGTFPGHAVARNQARGNIRRLMQGLPPEAAEDIPSYWLPPAVAALSPDGSVDTQLAARALQRYPEAARDFLAVAQGALGRGEAALGDLPSLLRTDGDGRWARWQVLVWSAVARGAFGPNALATIRDIVETTLSRNDDWEQWLREEHRNVPSPERADDVLAWALDQAEAPAPTTSAPKPQEGMPTDEEVGRAMLLESLTLLPLGSCPEEEALLAQARETRRAFIQKLAPVAEGQAYENDSPPVDVVMLLRDTAVSPDVPQTIRAWLWQRFLPRFSPIADDYAAQPQPAPPEIALPGEASILVGPKGVLNPSQLTAARAALHDSLPTGMVSQGLPVSLVGAAVVLLSLGLWVAGMDFLGFPLLVAGGLIVVLGIRLVNYSRDSHDRVRVSLEELDSNIRRTTKRAAEQHEEQLALWAVRRDCAARFLERRRRA